MHDSVSTRRAFIQKGLVLLAATPTIPTFLDQTLLAMANPEDMLRTQQPSGKDGKILVVVQLSGGNDGLNTVVPHGDDHYYRARPQINHEAKTVLKINDFLGLHPNLAPVNGLYDNGEMAIVQGVGYPNPNRSHFRSMDIWHTGEPEKEVATSGWMGRFFDNACPGCDPHVGVSIGETLPLAMRGERVTPLSFDRPENYRYNGRDKDRYQKLNTPDGTGVVAGVVGSPTTQPEDAIKPVAKPQATKGAKKQVEVVTTSSQLDFLTRTAMDAQLSSEQILTITRSHNPPQPYPNGEFGSALKNVAAMIKGGLPTRVYYVSLGGFDTHAQERQRHDQLMTQLAAGVGAFWADMKKQGNDQRVLMMTFSEFGRRVEQNASGGTDHGAAAPMFVIGGGVKAGVFGQHPSLTDLDQGDLKYNTDFRSVYATILQQWMDTPSKPILGQQFKLMPMIKA
jgi:uncharacterized protein (DUF1501 family)